MQCETVKQDRVSLLFEFEQVHLVSRISTSLHSSPSIPESASSSIQQNEISSGFSTSPTESW